MADGVGETVAFSLAQLQFRSRLAALPSIPETPPPVGSSERSLLPPTQWSSFPLVDRMAASLLVV